jgi:hypothetical protein
LKLHCALFVLLHVTTLSVFAESSLVPPGSHVFEAGKEIYKKKCSKCHDPLEASHKLGRTREDIVWASKNIPLMEKAQSLTEEELEALEEALKIENQSCNVADNYGGVIQLTIRELENTIFDLTGIRSDLIHNLPARSKHRIFENNKQDYIDNYNYISKIINLSENIAEKIITQSKWTKDIESCWQSKTSQACIDKMINLFMKRAFRRDVSTDETRETIEKFKTLSNSKEVYLKLVFQSILSSPFFFNRTSSPERREHTNYQLANQLSYFLWGSSPDDKLMDLAHKNKLNDQSQLTTEIKRMLADERATHLLESFFLQWSGVDLLTEKNIDTKVYPDFNDKQKAQAYKNAKRLFQYVFKGNRPLSELLNPEPGLWHFLTYLDHPKGLLTNPGWLIAHSNSVESSVTRRGKFIRERLLCTTLSPPLGEDKPHEKLDFEFTPGHQLTGRQQMTNHVSLSSCANCHQMMDPLGVAFENFDATGQFRSIHHGQKIDASTTFAGYNSIKNGAELQQVIAQTDRFKNCMVEILSQYALNRDIRREEICEIDRIRRKAEKKGFSITDVATEIVLSPIFKPQEGIQR